MSKQFTLFQNNKIRARFRLAFFAWLFFLVIFSPQILRAQQDSISVSSVPPAISESLLKPDHSPTKALWMSAVLPGLGQAYNKQYWKIPIIYVGGAVITYFAVDNYRNAQKFKNEYIKMDRGDTASLDPYYAKYPKTSIYNLYSSYNKNFQLTIILGGVVYLLNLLDAYVSAHLFTFDISDDITLNVTPMVNYHALVFNDNKSSQPEFGVKLRFTF